MSTETGHDLTDIEASAINSAAFMVEQALLRSDDPEGVEVIAATVVATAICYHAERFVDGCEMIAKAIMASENNS
ncbi:hypothetical protein [Azonexus hydrophilus]|uniref:hypothetical protein n=1 Tax=Azonexus hydrophilus TaxID=418702 RepID=UPI0004916F55|nr:hypothetical protein [Azonexus hydrophilus]